MEGSYTYEDHEITEKALKDSRFAKWFHQQMGYVFKMQIHSFLWKRRRRNRIWPDPDGTFRRKSQTKNRGLPSFIWNRKTKRTPTVSFKRWRKRKVSLACILSMNPEVLILDEPLAGLDESTQKMLIDFLKKFHAAGKH